VKLRHAIFALSVCLVASAFAGRAPADDEIIWSVTTTKKEMRTIGAIQSETPNEIVIKPSGETAANVIPVGKIVDVVYQVPVLVRQEYRGALNREAAAQRTAKQEERRRELASALQRYRELLPKLSEERAKRHVEFKIAKLHALQSGNDPAELPLALDHLSRFKNGHPQGWQLSACADLLANLQLARQDWTAAQKTFEDLAATSNLSAETRQACELKVARIQMRAGKYTQAQRKLSDLAKVVAPDSAQGLRLQIALAECRAAAGASDEAARLLEHLIAKIADPDLKAAAYNALGDCHRDAKKPREALWDYLWVDVVYPQDPQEHARALYHLSRLFQSFKDETRAKQFRDQLEKDPQFAGLEYQRRLMVEK
jgi:hypothetical protein